MTLRETFPLVAYLKVLGVASVGAGLGLLFKLSVDLPAGVMLAVVAVIVVGSFVVLGTLLRLIGKEEARYLAQWFRRKSKSSD